MTGPRDMKPWEVRLYAAYRQNLHNIKPTTKQGRNIHRLERALIIWPLHAYMWVKRRRTQPPPIEPPTGGFLTPENSQEDTWPLT